MKRMADAREWPAGTLGVNPLPELPGVPPAGAGGGLAFVGADTLAAQANGTAPAAFCCQKPLKPPRCRYLLIHSSVRRPCCPDSA